MCMCWPPLLAYLLLPSVLLKSYPTTHHCWFIRLPPVHVQRSLRLVHLPPWEKPTRLQCLYTVPFVFVLTVFTQNIFQNYLGQPSLTLQFSVICYTFAEFNSFVTVCIPSWHPLTSWLGCFDSLYTLRFIFCDVQFYGFWQMHNVINPQI